MADQDLSRDVFRIYKAVSGFSLLHITAPWGDPGPRSIRGPSTLKVNSTMEIQKLFLKGLPMGSTPMGPARKPSKNMIFEFWSRFWSEFVFLGPGEVEIV